MAFKQPTRRFESMDWIVAARRALIAGGVDRVKIDTLAAQMNISRSSFYWFFKNRGALLDALLEDWEETNTGPWFAAIKSGTTAQQKFEAINRMWIEEKVFSPGYDAAVRDWARTSSKVAKALHAVDEKRIEAFTDIFKEFGYSDKESFVRARITYFHQVGYYALHIKESREERIQLLPFYIQALTGRPLNPHQSAGDVQ